MKIKTELYNDNFQNYKRYGIPKAQLVIADIPYNLGNNAYASNPMWYEGERTKMEKAKGLGKVFLTLTMHLILPNTFISVISC